MRRHFRVRKLRLACSIPKLLDGRGMFMRTFRTVPEDLAAKALYALKTRSRSWHRQIIMAWRRTRRPYTDVGAAALNSDDSLVVAIPYPNREKTEEYL